jgi:hypothetical protein
MGYSRAPTKDFIQFCKLPKKKNNLIKASILFYYRLSPNLTALETIQYRPPCAFRWFPVVSIPRRSRVYSVDCCVYLSIGGRLRPRRNLYFLFFGPLIRQ